MLPASRGVGKKVYVLLQAFAKESISIIMKNVKLKCLAIC